MFGLSLMNSPEPTRTQANEYEDTRAGFIEAMQEADIDFQVEHEVVCDLF